MAQPQLLSLTVRSIGGRPLIHRGHQVEKDETGTLKALCTGESVPSAYLACEGDAAITCMDCALALDQEKLDGFRDAATQQ